MCWCTTRKKSETACIIDLNKINSCIDWGQLLICISLKRFLQVVKFLVFLYWDIYIYIYIIILILSIYVLRYFWKNWNDIKNINCQKISILKFYPKFEQFFSSEFFQTLSFPMKEFCIFFCWENLKISKHQNRNWNI